MCKYITVKLLFATWFTVLKMSFGEICETWNRLCNINWFMLPVHHPDQLLLRTWWHLDAAAMVVQINGVTVQVLDCS